MAVSESYLNYVQDQLSSFGDFETKKMFGGVGFFKDGIMFGMIGNGVLRLKVDAHNQALYEQHGMTALTSDGKKKRMPYWQVPETILEDSNELKKWAAQSFEAALRARK